MFPIWCSDTHRAHRTALEDSSGVLSSRRAKTEAYGWEYQSDDHDPPIISTRTSLETRVDLKSNMHHPWGRDAVVYCAQAIVSGVGTVPPHPWNILYLQRRPSPTMNHSDASSLHRYTSGVGMQGAPQPVCSHTLRTRIVTPQW